jgi:hypothetical protein
MIENYHLCYICKKPIKTNKYYSIGKNFEGLELYRHWKCKPNNLSAKELKVRKHWVKNPGVIIHKNKTRKSRQQKKIDLKKEQL